MDESTKSTVGPIEDMLRRLHVGAVFGEPIRAGEATLIPVAQVTYGFGYGSGGSAGSTPDADETAAASGHGAGGGGGGHARAVGYIRVTADGASYHPLFDPARVALAGILMIAWAVFWISRAVAACARRHPDRS